MNAYQMMRDPGRLAALCELWKDAGREIDLTMLTGSMNPTIPPGSWMTLRCMKEPPSPGEIVAYRRNEILVVHRFVAYAKDPSSEIPLLIFKGDACEAPDPPISLDDVVGRIIRIRKRAGFMRKSAFKLSQLRSKLKKISLNCRHKLLKRLFH